MSQPRFRSIPLEGLKIGDRVLRDRTKHRVSTTVNTHGLLDKNKPKKRINRPPKRKRKDNKTSPQKSNTKKQRPNPKSPTPDDDNDSPNDQLSDFDNDISSTPLKKQSRHSLKLNSSRKNANNNNKQKRKGKNNKNPKKLKSKNKRPKSKDGKLEKSDDEETESDDEQLINRVTFASNEYETDIDTINEALCVRYTEKISGKIYEVGIYTSELIQELDIEFGYKSKDKDTKQLVWDLYRKLKHGPLSNNNITEKNLARKVLIGKQMAIARVLFMLKRITFYSFNYSTLKYILFKPIRKIADLLYDDSEAIVNRINKKIEKHNKRHPNNKYSALKVESKYNNTINLYEDVLRKYKNIIINANKFNLGDIIDDHNSDEKRNHKNKKRKPKPIVMQSSESEMLLQTILMGISNSFKNTRNNDLKIILVSKSIVAYLSEYDFYIDKLLKRHQYKIIKNWYEKDNKYGMKYTTIRNYRELFYSFYIMAITGLPIPPTLLTIKINYLPIELLKHWAGCGKYWKSNYKRNLVKNNNKKQSKSFKYINVIDANDKEVNVFEINIPLAFHFSKDKNKIYIILMNKRVRTLTVNKDIINIISKYNNVAEIARDLLQYKTTFNDELSDYENENNDINVNNNNNYSNSINTSVNENENKDNDNDNENDDDDNDNDDY